MKYDCWTEKDDEIICREYPLHGSKIPELREKYKPVQIRARAQYLGLHISSRRKWTEEHVKLLREEFPQHSVNIPKLLEVFDKVQISQKAYVLGIKHTR